MTETLHESGNLRVNVKAWSDKELISEIASYAWACGESLLNARAKAEMKAEIQELHDRGLIHWRPT